MHNVWENKLTLRRHQHHVRCLATHTLHQVRRSGGSKGINAFGEIVALEKRTQSRRKQSQPTSAGEVADRGQ